MSHGYMGKLLHVDLTTGKIETLPLDEVLKRDFVGARGFAARLMWEWGVPKCDPLGPKNVLMFLTGPLTGTGAPCMRAVVASRSPLTGTYLDSFFGGFLGPEIKYAGYDGIILTGKAPEPSYLVVDDDRVAIRDARVLWGKTTHDLYPALFEDLGTDTYKVACIGPAGENLVRFALVDTYFHRQAGRGGAGAVMGSKNLKAIAVHGSGKVTVDDPKRFLSAIRKAQRTLLSAPGVAEFNRNGTLGGITDDSASGILPTFNYRQASFDGADGLMGHQYEKRIWLRNTACMGCVIACSKVGVIRRGKHNGLVCDNVEFESTGTMGSNLGFRRAEELQYANHLADSLGMDTMSCGGAVGFAIEAYGRGLLRTPDMAEIKPEFGKAEAIWSLIQKIAYRDGVGDLLAEGVKRASERLGGDAPRFAMHTKGLETPGYEPRGMPGHALGYATADRGGCHERGYLVHLEARGAKFHGQPVDRFTRVGKAQMLVEQQNSTAGCDTIVPCHFAGEAGDDTFVELLNAGVGASYSVENIYRVGERIWNQTKLFNLREGFTRADDHLPIRMAEEGLPDPGVEGQRIPQADLDYMLDDYYRLRGWDERGVPREEKLRELGI